MSGIRRHLVEGGGDGAEESLEKTCTCSQSGLEEMTAQKSLDEGSMRCRMIALICTYLHLSGFLPAEVAVIFVDIEEDAFMEIAALGAGNAACEDSAQSRLSCFGRLRVR